MVFFSLTPHHYRMMLSDAKLLERLRVKLAEMDAPLQADARVFQNKITEASERLEVRHGAQQQSVPASPLLL